MSSESSVAGEYKNLSGEVALVTGASRGIGQAVALGLKSRGATVIGTATGQAGLDAINAAGLIARQLDVTQASAAEALVDEVSKTLGSISILVNNAGITRDTLAMRMGDDDWDAVIQTNLSAVFRMARLVMRGMVKARAGRIINITSVVASMGNAGQANYAAAKAGVEGMTRALARELGGRNITVNSVAPGLIQT
jgi:3-oxoacyl-[acyl-carrier protein] reductase